MSNGEKREQPNKPSGGETASVKKPEKLSPAQILERMQTAQTRLEKEEEKRVDGLIQREKECEELVPKLQARLLEAKKALGIAQESIVGKKSVSEEYTAGFQELKEAARQTEAGLQALQAELDEIKKDPGVIERRKQEEKAKLKKKLAEEEKGRQNYQEEVKRKEQERIEAEMKELTEKAREEQEKIEKFAKELITFLIEDKGWAIDFDQLHQFEEARRGGRVLNEVAEIQREISLLAKEYDTILPQKQEKEQSWLKIGLGKMEEKIIVLNEKIEALRTRQHDLQQKARLKINEFDKIEKPLRYAVLSFSESLGGIEYLTKKKPEWAKIEVNENFVSVSQRARAARHDPRPLENYGIYKPFLKQFGFDVDDKTTWKKWEKES